MPRYSAAFGAWSLDDLPGCSQVCVSHSAFVLPSMRARGFGAKYHKERLEQMSHLKYDCAICTIDASNEKMRHILQTNGWTQFNSFKSGKTGHIVLMFYRNLKHSHSFK